MQKILRRLLDRLNTIADSHKELNDSEVREAMSDAVFDGFIRPVPDFDLPANYALFSDQGNWLVRQALAEFIAAANEHATSSGLASFHERLAAFQDDELQSASGSYYDDYFGWSNPKFFDDSGILIDRYPA